MKDWQFNILFIVGVGSAVFLAFAPAIGLDGYVTKNPSALSGVGLILAYVLTQKGKWTHKDDDVPKKPTDDDTDVKP